MQLYAAEIVLGLDLDAPHPVADAVIGARAADREDHHARREEVEEKVLSDAVDHVDAGDGVVRQAVAYAYESGKVEPRLGDLRRLVHAHQYDEHHDERRGEQRCDEIDGKHTELVLAHRGDDLAEATSLGIISFGTEVFDDGQFACKLSDLGHYCLRNAARAAYFRIIILHYRRQKRKHIRAI